MNSICFLLCIFIPYEETGRELTFYLSIKITSYIHIHIFEHQSFNQGRTPCTFVIFEFLSFVLLPIEINIRIYLKNAILIMNPLS